MSKEMNVEKEIAMKENILYLPHVPMNMSIDDLFSIFASYGHCYNIVFQYPSPNNTNNSKKHKNVKGAKIYFSTCSALGTALFETMTNTKSTRVYYNHLQKYLHVINYKPNKY